MKKLYITFGGRAYDGTVRHIVEDGERFGADRVLVYDDAWLEGEPFFRLPGNRWLWEHPGDDNGVKRGFGWYAWKPYIIMHALTHYCDARDIVLYTDGDTYPIANFSKLYEECEDIGGVMLFAANGCSNRQWVKRDCWQTMGHADPRPLLDSQHATARFMLFQCGLWKSHQFLMEWLTYCVNPLANTTDRSKLVAAAYGDLQQEFSGFSEHRSDQSILTLLGMKYGLKFYREADAFGNASQDDRDLYDQLFVQEYAHGDKTEIVGSQFMNVGNILPTRNMKL